MPNKNWVCLLERVSKPEIYWECSNTTLTCEVEKGTDLELKLYRGKKLLTSLHQKIIRYTWTNLNVPFKCSAKNKVSEESFTTTISCSGTELAEVRVVQMPRGSLLGLGYCDSATSTAQCLGWEVNVAQGGR